MRICSTTWCGETGSMQNATRSTFKKQSAGFQPFSSTYAGVVQLWPVNRRKPSWILKHSWYAVKARLQDSCWDICVLQSAEFREKWLPRQRVQPSLVWTHVRMELLPSHGSECFGRLFGKGAGSVGCDLWTRRAKLQMADRAATQHTTANALL